MNIAEHLRLTRPLSVIDVETTGASFTRDRIVQISITVHYPDKEPVQWMTFVNPEMAIPPEITAKHHITDEMVAAAPLFASFAEPLSRTALGHVDYCGQNVSFDLRMIRAEMVRVPVAWDWEKTNSRIIDTLKIEQRYVKNTLSAIYKRRTGKDLEGAHDAGVDVNATTEVLIAQLTQETDLPRTVAELSDLCFPRDPLKIDAAGKFIWRNREVCFGFGKNQGRPVREEMGYVAWMVRQNFDGDTVAWCERFLREEFPTPTE